MAENVIGLFKTEVIRRRGPWKGIEDVEFATLDWVAWFNLSRLLEPLGYVPPIEFEDTFYRQQAESRETASQNRRRATIGRRHESEVGGVGAPFAVRSP